MASLILWVPLLASAICLAVKGALFAAGVQDFNLRGMPSGHSAVMAALITLLALGLPETSNALGVAIAFTALYGSDLMLFYYGGPSARDGKPLGHTYAEVGVGAAIGAGVALAAHALLAERPDE